MMLLQATKAAASLPDLTSEEADADVAPMNEDYDALEAEAEAELAALAAEAASAAQGAGSRSEDGGVVMLPVGHARLRCQFFYWSASVTCIEEGILKLCHGRNVKRCWTALTQML